MMKLFDSFLAALVTLSVITVFIVFGVLLVALFFVLTLKAKIIAFAWLLILAVMTIVYYKLQK